jgi:predicted component of type VI protein secretion system
MPLARLIPRSGAPFLVVGAPAARIGADAVAEVVIVDPTVAAVHATLRLQGGVWMLEDLGSDGGSWVDGDAVAEPHPVAPGSVIRLGTVELVFEPQDRWTDSPAAADPPHAPADAAAPAAHPPLFMIDPAPTGSGWLPWVLVGGVVLVAIAAILLSGGSR